MKATVYFRNIAVKCEIEEIECCAERSSLKKSGNKSQTIRASNKH